MTKLMTGQSHTLDKGKDFAIAVMKHLKQVTQDWKKETGLGFALYGTPAESLCYRFAKIDKEHFGEIEDVTDKGYYTNSYHVDVREEIDAFSKLAFESEFQEISTGGCISYVEIPNMQHNLEALEEMVRFIYDNIQYAEFNTKSDYCHVCGFDGEIKINGGTLGGIVKIADVVSQLNALEQDLNTLKTVFASWVPVAQDGGASLKIASEQWSAAQIQPTTVQQLEDTTFKH